MNKLLAGAMIAALALTGCKTKSEEGGGAGNDTFRLVVPTAATTVKQGELQTVRVTIERGAGFKQQLSLALKAPTGIQVDPATVKVQPGDVGDVQVKITAAADAAIGDHRIQVKGTPDKGEPTSTEFVVTVSAP